MFASSSERAPVLRLINFANVHPTHLAEGRRISLPADGYLCTPLAVSRHLLRLSYFRYQQSHLLCSFFPHSPNRHAVLPLPPPASAFTC